jgi:hypothetical protein
MLVYFNFILRDQEKTFEEFATYNYVHNQLTSLSLQFIYPSHSILFDMYKPTTLRCAAWRATDMLLVINKIKYLLDKLTIIVDFRLNQF